MHQFPQSDLNNSNEIIVFSKLAPKNADFQGNFRKNPAGRQIFNFLCLQGIIWIYGSVRISLEVFLSYHAHDMSLSYVFDELHISYTGHFDFYIVKI